MAQQKTCCDRMKGIVEKKNQSAAASDQFILIGNGRKNSSVDSIVEFGEFLK
jgi:hypothetical protein